MKNHRELYLWYPVVLLFPWVHELGHCCIAWCMGYRVIELHLTSMNYVRPVGDMVNVVQNCWEWSCAIPLVTILVWFFLVCKDVKIYCYSGAGSFQEEKRVCV